MIPSESAPLSVVRRFTLHSYSSATTYDLKAIPNALPEERVDRLNRECSLVTIEPLGRIFIFQFGSAVFCDVTPDLHPRYLTRLQRALKPAAPVPDSLGMTTDDIAVEVVPQKTNVAFQLITVPSDDIARMHLIALMLARSSALELVENEVTQFLEHSEQLTNSLVNPRRFVGVWDRHKLLRFLGQDLATRHRIVNRFALFDMPERAWENEEYYTLYRELYAEFDLQDRLEMVEKMLNLSSQVSSLLLNIGNARQAEVLEIIIILLIAVELLGALF